MNFGACGISCPGSSFPFALSILKAAKFSSYRFLSSTDIANTLLWYLSANALANFNAPFPDAAGAKMKENKLGYTTLPLYTPDTLGKHPESIAKAPVKYTSRSLGSLNTVQLSNRIGGKAS